MANAEAVGNAGEVAPEPPRAVAEMPAEFGLWTATFIIVASMVGAGVLTTSGYTVASVGSNELMLGLWLLGGIVAACGALTLCELTAAMPSTGGDYVYLHAAYGPLVAFLSGWISFLIGFGAPSASAAFGAAKYLTAPLDLDPSQADPIQRLIGTVLVLVFVAVHVSGRKQTAQVQGWVTSLKLLLLVLFLVAGLAAPAGRWGNLFDRPPVADMPVLLMLSSLVYIGYAYTGWNSASYLAGEFVDPQRQLPRAILLGTFGVTILYLGLNIVYALAFSAPEVRAIASKEDVAPIAALSAQVLFGPRLSGPLSVAFGLMLLSSLSAYVLTGPRVLYAMAAAGQFPAVAARLTRRSATPWVATLLQTITTLVFLWVSSLASLIQYAGIGLSISGMLAIAAVYVLRFRRPDLPRPFRTPGYPVTPAVFLVVTLALTVAVFVQEPRVSALALLSILAGVPFYWLWNLLGGTSPAKPGPPEAGVA